MRHAFLIIAHNNWWQLKQLIMLLDARNHDIYIHIDKKSMDFRMSDFIGISQESNVSFFQEYEVYWGGFSLVRAELLLLEEAHNVHYDYYHIISGADLPLKDNHYIDGFFEANKGKQFIQFDDVKLKNDNEISRRTKYYHFLQNFRRRYSNKWKNEFFTFCERVLLVIQIILRINRVKQLDWVIKYGSNWVSITDELVTVILSQKEKIEKVFSHTNCADELFIQTVAFNCGFAKQIYQAKNNQEQNVRHIDWNRGKNGNPYTFRLQDRDMLFDNNNLFARKFSEDIDREIIEIIVNKVKGAEVVEDGLCKE